VILQFAREQIAGRPDILRKDIGHHDFSPCRIRLADDGAFAHGRVGEQHVLDLARTDPVAGGVDDVVGAAAIPEIAVAVADAAVAGDVPATVRSVAEAGGGALGLLPVAEHQLRVRRRERDVAFFAPAAVRAPPRR
jgi:hypothetical protein